MPSARVRTATAVKPGDLRSIRAAKRRSCQHVSTKDSQPPERTISLLTSRLPRSKRTARRASWRLMPCFIFSSVAISRYSPSSSSNSRFTCSFRNSDRSPVTMFRRNAISFHSYENSCLSRRKQSIGAWVHFHPSLWLSESHELLVTEGLDRIKPGGFPGRINSKHHANERAKRQRSNNPKQGQHRRKMQARPKEHAQSGTEQHSNDAADGAQGHRLDQELSENIAPLCADGLPDADFPGPFRYRNEHNIHHPNAAHDQPDRSNRKHQKEDQAADLVPEIEKIIGCKQSKIVRLVVGEPPLATQQIANFFDRLADLRGIAGFCENHVILLIGIEFPQRSNRHDRNIVFGIGASGNALTPFIHGANHREELATDDHFPAGSLVCAFRK